MGDFFFFLAYRCANSCPPKTILIRCLVAAPCSACLIHCLVPKFSYIILVFTQRVPLIESNILVDKVGGLCALGKPLQADNKDNNVTF